MCNSFVGERHKEGVLSVAIEEVDCRVGEDLRQISVPKFPVIPVVRERPDNRAVSPGVGCAVFDVLGEEEMEK